MTDGTRILRTAGIPLVIAIAMLYIVPKECAKVVQVSKQRQERARAASGLHIESSAKPVTYPAGLDPERVRYLIEVDSLFSAPALGRLHKTPPAVTLPSEQTLLAALLKLGYAETAPDNSITITRDGLLHLDGLVDDGTTWTIPLAKREFRSITTVDPDGGNALARFVWQWQPTMAGAELVKSPRRHDAKAELTSASGRWTLVRMVDLDSELE
ncbi:MAG: hypothetical protein QOC81_4343 [Thermoanaerobaculia bacterium]|jgi:hypothetical protein|nr:hypothetical protein [Thermoanaerobaculia bacterium]